MPGAGAGNCIDRAAGETLRAQSTGASFSRGCLGTIAGVLEHAGGRSPRGLTVAAAAASGAADAHIVGSSSGGGVGMAAPAGVLTEKKPPPKRRLRLLHRRLANTVDKAALSASAVRRLGAAAASMDREPP